MPADACVSTAVVPAVAVAIALICIQPPRPPLLVVTVCLCRICRLGPGPAGADKQPALPLTVVLRTLINCQAATPAVSAAKS